MRCLSSPDCAEFEPNFRAIEILECFKGGLAEGFDSPRGWRNEPIRVFSIVKAIFEGKKLDLPVMVECAEFEPLMEELQFLSQLRVA